MTLDELKKIIQDLLTPLKAQIDELKAEALQAKDMNEASKKELADKIAKAEELVGQYEKSLDELAKAKERKEMPNEGDPNNPFVSLGHLGYELVKAGKGWQNASDELKAWNAHCKATMNASDLEEGAALIPPEFSRDVLERVSRTNSFMANAMIVPMASLKLTIPMITGFDESQGVVYGNTKWSWHAEDTQRTSTSNFTTGAVELVLHKCIGLSVVTDELTKFSPVSINAILNRAFDKGMNFVINKAVLRGSGAGEPQGILNAKCKIAVPKATNQDADTFIYDNVLDMLTQLYSMDDEAIGTGSWYMNKTVLPQLGKLNLAVGTGGSAVFVATIPPSLFGLPIRWSSQMSALGDEGDVTLIDPAQYIIGQPAAGGPGDPTMETSVHLYFDWDKTAFKFTFYMDGQPWWPETYTPLYGKEQSPFVALAART